MILTFTILCKKHFVSLEGFTEDHTVFIKACRECLREEKQAGVDEALERMRVHLGKGGDKLWEVTLPKQGFP